MTEFVLTLRRGLWRMLPPTLIAMLIACALALSAGEASQGLVEPSLAGPLAATYWLQLPALMLAAATIVTTLEDWPGFGRERQDARWIRPHLRSMSGGCISASLAGLTVLSLSLTATALAFAFCLSIAGPTPPAPRPQVALTPVADAAATAPGAQSLRFAHPKTTAQPITSLVLRPRVRRRAGGGISTVAITVSADGAPLHNSPLLVTGSSERHTLNFTARSVRDVELRIRSAASSPGAAAASVDFGSDGVVAVEASQRSLALNLIFALLSTIAPAALALGAACALRRWLANGVAIVTACGLLLLATVTGWTPQDELLQQVAESRWIPTWADAMRSVGTEPGAVKPGERGMLGSAVTAYAQALGNLGCLGAAALISCIGGPRR